MPIRKITKKKVEEIVPEVDASPVVEASPVVADAVAANNPNACISCNGSGRQNADDLCVACQGSGRKL